MVVPPIDDANDFDLSLSNPRNGRRKDHPPKGKERSQSPLALRDFEQLGEAIAASLMVGNGDRPDKDR